MLKVRVTGDKCILCEGVISNLVIGGICHFMDVSLSLISFRFLSKNPQVPESIKETAGKDIANAEMICTPV